MCVSNAISVGRIFFEIFLKNIKLFSMLNKNIVDASHLLKLHLEFFITTCTHTRWMREEKKMKYDDEDEDGEI